MIVAVGLLSWLDHKHWWIWPPLIFSIQFIVVSSWSKAGENNLWPIAIALYAIYMIPLFIGSGLSAYLVRRHNVKERRTETDIGFMTRREKLVIATATSILFPVLLSIFIANRMGSTHLTGDLAYWFIGYPALLAVSVLLSWINPSFWWAWSPLMTAVQIRIETWFDHDAYQIPLIVILGLWIVYTIPLWITSGLVGRIARRRKQRLAEEHGLREAT